MSDESRCGEPIDILLVEDNPGDLRLTEEVFEAAIWNALHVATGGAEALDFRHRRGDHADAPRPDVVLLDHELGRTDAEEVLAEIRGDSDLADLPVVVLASSQAHADALASGGLEAHDFLTKPVDPEEFVAVARSIEGFWLSVVRQPSSEGR